MAGRIGSVAILVAPAPLVLAFISEPDRSDFHFAEPAIYACALCVVLPTISAVRRGTRTDVQQL